MPSKDHRGIRPTQAFVVRWLFDKIGPPDGTRVLELFAGTGTVGVQALFKGADLAVFVDKDRRATRAITKRLRQKGLEARARVMCLPVKKAIKQLADQRFDWCFADPPYGMEGLEDHLAGLAQIVGLLVLEQSDRDSIVQLPGFILEKTARLRDVRLAFYRGLPRQL